MEQPPLPQDQNGSSTNGANKNPGFKLKINEGEASTPLPHLPDEDPEDKLPNAYVDFSGRLLSILSIFCFYPNYFRRLIY